MAKWGGFVLIGFYGYWAARFSGAPVPRALARAALVGLIAAFLIVLEAALHQPAAAAHPANAGFIPGG